MKRLLIAIAAFFWTSIPAQASSNSSPHEIRQNDVVNRIVKIQQEYQTQQKSPRILDKLNITQWVNFPNFPNWPNWSDWNDNWNNWYNY